MNFVQNENFVLILSLLSQDKYWTLCLTSSLVAKSIGRLSGHALRQSNTITFVGRLQAP